MMSLRGQGRPLASWSSVAPITQNEVAAQPVRPRHAAQGAGGLHLRQRQPPPRHPPPAAPLHEGKLKLDELVTTTYDLDDVNQGYQDMRDGKNIRRRHLLRLIPSVDTTT